MSTAMQNPNSRLKALVAALRDLHRNLVDVVKAEYEGESGGVIDAAHLLQLLTKDPHFAWLHELSEFMVVVDELLDNDDVPEAEAREIISQARTLIAPSDGNTSEFYRRYVVYLQHHPALTMSHANIRKLLTQA
jgi:hypothetical protein